MGEKERAFTPGPWVAETPAGRGAWIKGANGEYSALACGDSDESAAANACLIAEAPTLLKMLQHLLTRIQMEMRTGRLPMGWADPLIAEVRAAIAKVLGAP